MELKEWIRSRDYASLKSKLKSENVVGVIALLSKLKPYDQAIAFRAMSSEQAAQVFPYLESEERKRIIKNLTQKEIIGILDNLQADDSADFLGGLPSAYVDTLLGNLDAETKDDITRLLKYEHDTVGSIMTVEYVALDQNSTVSAALDKLRAEAQDSETIYTCYVLEQGRLIGIVTAKDLILASGDSRIGDIMNRQFVSLKDTDDKAKAAELFYKYGFFALPVVDKHRIMQGIVTIDDGIYVMQEEVTEDMQKMAGIRSDDTGYFNKSIWFHAKQRVAWLLFLMISASVTGAIISHYEAAFQVLPLLVAFIPMLMDTGGNCGAQSSTLIIRGITTKEIQFKDILRIIWTEFRVSLLVSAILAVTNGFHVYFRYQNVKLAAAVSLSLIATVIVSKFIGAILPLLASKVKLDPAVMAAPLITTIVDSCSILIYFKIASAMFGL